MDECGNLNSLRFETECIHMDVLALRNYCDFTLAGIGSNLFVFRNRSVELVLSIFVNERIHNIYVKKDLILLKGGKHLALVKLQENEGCIKCQQICRVQCSDWIQDIIILNETLIGMVTAHNVFEVWKPGFKGDRESRSCNDKYVLYSSKILGESLENILIFAGTVFGEVMVWAPFLNSKDNIIQRFIAHTGAVFSVEVSVKEKIVATTSDDRSLRLWSINSKEPLNSLEQWKKINIQLVHNLYGHTARVWKSLIFSDYYITIGEDSQLIVWTKAGTLWQKMTLHQESGIRSLCFSEQRNTITTGGEDGGINSVSLHTLTTGNKSCVQSKTLKSENNFSVRACFVTNGYVYTTNGGCILVNAGEEEFIYKNENFLSYCLLEVSSLGDQIALGSIKGHIVIIDVLNKSLIINGQYVDGRVYSIHWVGDLILTCGPNGCLNLWKLSSADLKCVKTFTLPKCKERWTTCALLQPNNLIVGDRMGNVYVYDVNGADVPVHTFRKIHNYLGVTDILGDTNSILTIGRDGTFKTYSESFKLLSTYKLPMEWPWKIISYKNDKLILGFLGSSFLAWSLKHREIIAIQECGGGHRSCHCRLEGNKLNFLFIKEKQVVLVELELDTITRLRSGFHGKEINTLKIIQENPIIVVTGSEDTTMRISSIFKSEIDVLQVLKTHLSSIRTITVCQFKGDSLLIVSAGGKGQLILWKYDAVSRMCEELVSHRLHNANRCWKNDSPMVDPENRIMCADILGEKNEFLIVLGCSDRQIRLFLFKDSLTLLCTRSYTHCILKIAILEVHNVIYVVTFATNGTVVFWQVTEEKSIDEMSSFSLHQSGINCFAFEEIQAGFFILITGGDDNNICISSVRFDKDVRVKLNLLWSNCKTHSCQVTGVKVMGNSLITTSIDQRITLWRWSYVAGKFEIDYSDQRMTDVPDVQGLDAVRSGDNKIRVVVFGKGIEILTLTGAGI